MLKEKDPSLDGFFNMLFQSMDPANKNSNTKKSLLQFTLSITAPSMVDIRNVAPIFYAV